MPGLLKTLKKWIRDSYDYLGLVLISSFVWFGTFLAGMAIISKVAAHAVPIALLGMVAGFYVVVLAPLAAGVYCTARKILTHDEPSPADVLRGFREFYYPAFKLGLFHVLITFLLAGNAWFYLTRPSVTWRALGIVVIYALILWLLSAIYHFPLLIEQKAGALKTLKRGFLLALDNVAFTLGVFFAIILLTCLCAGTLLGLPLLYLGMLSILETRAMRAVFVKYELLPPEREYVPGSETDTFRLQDEIKGGSDGDGGRDVSGDTGSGPGGEAG